MRQRTRFSVGNMLRATTWAAASLGAWSAFWYSGKDETQIQLAILAFFMLVCPLVAITALFGRARYILIPAAFLFGALIVFTVISQALSHR